MTLRPLRRLGLLIALACLLATSFAIAAGDTPPEAEGPLPEFNVELVAFRHKVDPFTAGEHWPVDAGRPDFTQANIVDLSSPKLPEGFARVTREERVAAELNERLARARDYRTAIDAAWRQPVGERELSPWVLVNDHAGLSGLARVSLSRYLHLDLDMQLALPPAESSLEPRADHVHIVAHRRVRSGELHYIDHPLVGILVRIERFERPEPVAPPTPAAAEPAPPAVPVQPEAATGAEIRQTPDPR